MNWTKKILMILGVLLCCGGLAQASLITIQITGEVTSVTAQNVPTSLTESIHVGDIFTGTYTYDTSTPDSDASPNRGNYQHNSPYGINVSVGGFNFRTVPNHTEKFVVKIEDDLIVNTMRDGYSIVSSANIALTDFPSYSIEWMLQDSTHTALSSTALPETSPVLNNWDWYRFTIGGSKYIQQGDYWQGFSIHGTVTQAMLVPEPLTGVLLMTGVLLLRRRR